MKRTTLVALCAAALAVSLASSANASGITAGNIIVNQFGLDGAGSGLSGSSAAVRLKEFTTTGTLVQSIDMPTAAGSGTTPNALTASGSAASEGEITLSGNGQYLTLGGYATAPGTSSVASSAATSINRVVGRITVATGAIDTTTALTNAYSGSNIRGAASTDGTNIWASGNGGSGQGATGGTQYTTLGATTSSQIQSLNSNMRDVNIFNGQLYASTASTNLGVCTIGSGLPTGLTNNPVLLPGFNAASAGLGTSASNYDFWFKDASTLYVADDSSQAANGGIQKWTFDGTKWNNVYTFQTVTPLVGANVTFGARGLAGTTDGSGNAVLYATTSLSTTTLITITDTGSGAIATTLAAAPANTAFRGVEIIPVPEPASLILGGLGLIGMIGISRRRS